MVAGWNLRVTLLKDLAKVIVNKNNGHHEYIHIAGTTVPYTKGVCVWKEEKKGGEE